MLVLFISNMTSATSGAETANTLVTPVPSATSGAGTANTLVTPVPSQGHYGFHSFPVVD